MTTLFADAWQAGAVLDDHFGEDFLIWPTLASTPGQRIDVNAPTRSDPANQPLLFTGTARLESVQRFPDARGHSSSDARQFGASVEALSYATASLSYRPRQKDFVQRVATGDYFEVSGVTDTDAGRTILKLTARRRAA